MTGFQILSMKLPNILRKMKADYKTKDKVQNMEGQMKGMMNFMLIMVIFTGFMLPAALAIYWTIGSVFMILQTLVFQSDKAKAKLNSLANRKKKAKVVQ
jgi:membrane protein insertase Oxa1/YidC/SpoIIIJ